MAVPAVSVQRMSDVDVINNMQQSRAATRGVNDIGNSQNHWSWHAGVRKQQSTLAHTRASFTCGMYLCRCERCLALDGQARQAAHEQLGGRHHTAQHQHLHSLQQSAAYHTIHNHPKTALTEVGSAVCAWSEVCTPSFSVQERLHPCRQTATNICNAIRTLTAS